jgi:putative membrane protein
MPELNAALNLLSALQLILGYIFIRRRAVTAHKLCMLGATLTSALFLAGYLYYHYHHGSTRFPGTGGARTLYFWILIPHTILAAVQVPLIYMTLRHAFVGRFEAHRRWARVTLPIWLYVSVTGVLIYWMLYRIKWS